MRLRNVLGDIAFITCDHEVYEQVGKILTFTGMQSEILAFYDLVVR